MSANDKTAETLRLTLRSIAEFPAPEQDDMPAANMRQIARNAIEAQGAPAEPQTAAPEFFNAATIAQIAAVNPNGLPDWIVPKSQTAPAQEGPSDEDLLDCASARLSAVAPEGEILASFRAVLTRYGSQPGDVTPTEALFGFAAWLTCRPGTLTLGAAHESGQVVPLIEQYRHSQGWPAPREDYTTRLRPMPDDPKPGAQHG